VRFVLLISLCLLAAGALAQVVEVPGKKLGQPPIIDGTITDDEWKEAARAEGLFDEETGAVAPDGAQFWIGYDANYVYFAARAADANPSQIRATEYRTNVSLEGDDSVGVAIDITGSGSDFNVFRVNPRGATEIELAGGRAAKREWTGEFLAKARITETGWEAEARIPWQVMRLTVSGSRNLRINFGRRVARTNREFIHQFVPDSMQTHPVWKAVEVPTQRQQRTLKLLPYVYAGWDPNTGHIGNAGLDLKTQLTDQVELVGTINPDFRNIENDILSLDFSRFERIAGETRPFFQEGREYIETGIFASQRIDNFDLGLNTYGRLGDRTSFAVLDTVDWDRLNVIDEVGTRGTRNNLVANLTHFLDQSFNVRASYTNMDRPDLNNEAHLFRLSKTFGDFNIFARTMGSRDSQVGSGQSNDAYLNYSRGGLGAYVGYESSSPDFNPRLGFFQDRNFKGWSAGSFYNRAYDKGPVNDWGFEINTNAFERYNGDPYRHSHLLVLFTTLRNGLALVPYTRLGEFNGVLDSIYGFEVAFPRGNPYRHIEVGMESGKIGDEKYESIEIGGAYRTLGKLQINASFQRVKFMGEESQGILSANYDLGNDRSIAGRMVRRDQDTNFYVALRQSGNLGAEYFLILGDPNARTFRSSLILKVVVPFEIPLGSSGNRERQTVSKL
jgi:hypothetical protein